MTLGVGLVLVSATQSHAGAAIALDMPAQSLSLTLKRVARAGSVELAFDRAVTDKLSAPRLKGRFTVDQALAAALATTGLGVQRTSDGAYVVKPVSGPPRAKPVDSSDGAVSEILVLGRRNLNTGIRRTRDDIQPYDVALDETIRNAGDTDIEGFMRRTMPADAQSASLTQAPVANAASARSRIDLLGLGSGQTLVLVDGRRLPSLPEAVGAGAGFVQADVNGIPLDAIERIEVLTAAAGALYGPGATGGVVNIILKRDYQGAQVRVTQGLTQHGGGRTRRVDASIGATSPDGRSGVSVRVALASNQGLNDGERLFHARLLAVTGADLESGLLPSYQVPVGAAANVVSENGPLTLKPAFGGTALGSAFTSFSTTTGFTAAEVVANAGKLNLGLAPDAFGETQSLVTRTLRRSMVVSARHEAGIFEGFADYLFLDNRGRANVPAGDAVLSIGPDSPYSPFQQPVRVSRSLPWSGLVHNRSFTQRANAGLIARLPEGWMVEGDLSWSQATTRVASAARGNIVDALFSAGYVPGTIIGPDLSPFAAQTAFLDAYQYYQVEGGSLLKLSDTLGDVNLRASGPLWRLPGGPMTMTLTAEASHERAPGGASSDYSYWSGEPESTLGNQIRLTTRSAYAEWRAPLGATDAPGPLKGLELQAALRVDAYRMNAPQSNQDGGVAPKSVVSDIPAKHTVLAKALGLRTFVVDGVMLRASYSEGHLPPRSDQVQSIVTTIGRNVYFRTDPRRSGEVLGSNQPFLLIKAGSPKVDPERARTFSVGLVLEPRWLTGARLSVDYLRTNKSREITDFASGDVNYFLDREAQYPTRIVRAALTDVDRAKGYTVGAITVLDTSALNVGRSVTEAVDVSAEYRHPVGRGLVGGYLRGTWQPSYRRRTDPRKAWIETAGYSDGPLRLRAFAGAQWSIDAFSLGLNAQYYGQYKAADSGFPPVPVELLGRQKNESIRPQIYLDAVSRWSIGERTQIQVIVRNLLDTTPPLAVAAPTGYSTYGDAQGRSLEISLAQRF